MKMEDNTKVKYEYALQRIEELLPLVSEDTPFDDPNSIELDIVSDIVEKYEQEHYPVDKPTLGSLIREALDNAGMTAKELASRIGVSASRVSEYIHDKSQPSLRVTRQICETLGLSPNDIISAA